MQFCKTCMRTSLGVCANSNMFCFVLIWMYTGDLAFAMYFGQVEFNMAADSVESFLRTIAKTFQYDVKLVVVDV